MEFNPLDAESLSPASVAFPVPEQSPVVVVDDEPAVLELLKRALEGEGYPVETFDSARIALERIARGGVALLVTEIRMPDVSGMELVRSALEENPNLATLVLTGAADTGTAVESLRLGIDDYLQKPISVTDLIESVGRALRRWAQNAYRLKLERWLRAEVSRRAAAAKRRSEELMSLSVATLSAPNRAMEAKDPFLNSRSEHLGPPLAD